MNVESPQMFTSLCRCDVMRASQTAKNQERGLLTEAISQEASPPYLKDKKASHHLFHH